jgi:hypothetical protein
MSKYQKRVLTSGVPTQILRAFLKFLMRASSSDTQNVWCVHPSDIWSRVRLTKLPIARFLSVLCYVLKIPNTVFMSQTAQTVETWISQSLAFCGYRRPRQETCGTVCRYRHFGRTCCWKSLKTLYHATGDTFWDFVSWGTRLSSKCMQIFIYSTCYNVGFNL